VKIIEKYLGLSLPIKLIASSLIFVIAGPGFFYFLTEYATYFYIVSQGVRVPFEGVPYLSATVALLSVVLALCASLIFVITRLIIASIGAQIVGLITNLTRIADEGLKKYREDGGELFHKLSFSNIISLIEGLSLRNLSILCFVFFLAIAGIVNFIGIPSTKDKLALVIAFSFYITVALFTLWSKTFSWFVAVIVVLVFYISSINFLMDSDRYKVFLQVVGYGGGIPIKVQYIEGSKVEDLNLIIRSSTALLSERNESGEYSEIPMRNVKKIIYKKHSVNIETKVLTKNSS